MTSFTQGKRGRRANVKAQMQRCGTQKCGWGAQNCRVCLHLWGTGRPPGIKGKQKGVQQRGGLGRMQETPGGGAKTSKVAAIMAADGHWRALSTKWHKVKAEQGATAGLVQQVKRWCRKKNSGLIWNMTTHRLQTFCFAKKPQPHWVNQILMNWNALMCV